MVGYRRKIHYPFEEKKRILENYLTDEKYKNMSLLHFSKVCSVCYSTLREWGTTIGWDPCRIEELCRKKRSQGKVCSSGGLSEVVQEIILAVKQHNPQWGPLKIKQYLWRHEQLLVPQSSIYKFLKGKSLVTARPSGSSSDEQPVRRFEYATPLAAVQMDLMQLKLAGGHTLHLVSMLDDFSRFILASRFIAVKTMDEVLSVFRSAIRSYGVMDRLLTDCGSEFVSWQRFTRFEELLSSLDVEYIASGPDKKESQGKIERWHQTVRESLHVHGPLLYGSEAQLWIGEVVDRYNYERPHQGIGGLVPADRFFGMHAEIESELAHCRASQSSRQIYLVCRAGGHKLVVSGPRSEEVTVLVDGRSVSSSVSFPTDHPVSPGEES